MLFHTFRSQEERRAYGGSAFIEIQFCRLPAGTALKKIVAVGSIQNWKDDSLYVDDEVRFFNEYSPILDCGTYNNLKNGVVDIFGINYYTPAETERIMKKLTNARPADHEVFLKWLKHTSPHHGFYILGV